MLSTLLLIAPLVAPAAAAPAAVPAAKLKVVTTIPDLADIVRTIGGERVEVDSITRGRENLHLMTARPSHLVALSRADMYVQVGLSLEAAFAPGLLLNARNDAIEPGGPGFVNVSDGWEAIEVPQSLSRKAGDLHPQGNPHMNLDPRAGRFMARAVHEALLRLDPAARAGYDERFAAYAKELDAAQTRWSELRETLRGKRIAVYHQEFNYLARYHGIEIVGSIELRPGIPPTPNHLAELIDAMRREDARVILIAPWSRNRDVERVAERTGAALVEVPNQAGGSDETATWIDTMDTIHERLAAALEAR
jgi:ABC-type Zn uptake system ZnuABC Zn-binding protein ZnuA